MANKFLIKRGDGAPVAGSIDEYELVYDYTNNQLYTKVGSTITAIGSASSGDIEGVTAGTGLSGGGTSGTVTLSLGNHSGDLITSGTVAAARIANLAASKITSGTFADARISSSSITQHTDPKYLRSDAADTATGLLTLNGGVHILSGTGGGKLRIKRNSGSTDGDDIVDLHMDDGGLFFDNDNDNDADSGNFTFRYKTGGSFTNLLAMTNSGISYKGNTIPTISNMANNRIVTGATSTTIRGESNLTFDGNYLRLSDNKLLIMGAGDAFQIGHKATYSQITTYEGHLYIDNNANDQDIILRSDNGSGGVTPYITLDGGDYRVYMFGTRMQIRNDGTLHWGSAANHGVLTWDTGRAIVSAKGTNNLDLKAASGYQVVVNESGSNVDFRVEGDTDSNLLFTNADNDRVGIGTSSPSQKLHVNGSIKADTSLLIGSNSNFLTTQLKVGDGTRDIRLNANHSSNAVVGTVGSHDFNIMTANTFRMKIHSDGLVRSIGNHVFGVVSANSKAYIRANNGYSTAATPDYTWWYNDTCGIFHPAANTIGFSVGNNEMGRFTTDGLGIGEDDIDANLHVTGSPVVFKLERAGHRAVRMGVPDNTSNFVVADSDDLKSNRHIDMDSSGNIGIGTTTTTHKFHIDSNSNTNSVLRIDADDARGANRYALDVQDDDGNRRGTARFRHTTGSGNPPIIISEGYDHAYIFQSKNTSASDAEQFRIEHYDGNVRINSLRGTLALQNTGGGNIGVGTTVPGALFTVKKDGTQASSVSTTYQIQTVSDSNGGIAIQAGSSSTAYLVFGDNGDYDAGRIGYKNASHDLCFFTNNAEEMVLDSDGDLHVDRDVVAFSTTPSDKKLKTNIQDINYGLETIMKLSPKQYDWKKDDTHDIGFIAQEVEEVIPEIVKDKKHFDKEIKTLDYEKLTAVLIKAVQEQQERINKLEEKLNV